MLKFFADKQTGQKLYAPDLSMPVILCALRFCQRDTAIFNLITFFTYQYIVIAMGVKFDV